MLKNFQVLPIVNAKGCQVYNPDLSGKTLITNFPNPFEGLTTIQFSTEGGHTLVQVIDMAGRVVANLVDKVYSGPTTDRIQWTGGGLAAGSYYARLQNGPISQVRHMLKVR
jgi:hypothetical protein